MSSGAAQAPPHWARAWLGWCGRVERTVTFTAFLLMVTVVFADVAARELTGTGLHWARQAGVYANLVVVMLGIGLAAAEAGHLRPRFADGWLPASWDPWLNRVSEGLMALFCLTFAAVAGGVVADSFAMGERSTVLRIVVWPFQAVIPLAFGLAAIRHALYGLYPALAPRGDAGSPGVTDRD
jgi:TRAP-type C4-dicarboxylate transport system permease small subunit